MKKPTDLENKKIFAKNLKRYMNLHNKTQKEVAAAIGVTSGTFCDWMKERAYPRADKMQALVAYFGIQVSDLTDDTTISRDYISEEDQDILDLFHEVPEEKRELVLSMIRAAVGKL